MNPILKLFANRALPEILNILLLNADEEFYQADLAKKTNQALIQIQRATKTLEFIGLITSTKKGRMIYYKAVKNHPAFEDLKRLFFKTLSIGAQIQHALHSLKTEIDLAFIFGSVAKNNETTDSDIDLFIVSNLPLRKITSLLGPLSKELQKELNPVVFESTEFQNKISKNDHFLLQLLESPKIWIIGNDTLLKQMVKGRQTKAS